MINLLDCKIFTIDWNLDVVHSFVCSLSLSISLSISLSLSPALKCPHMSKINGLVNEMNVAKLSVILSCHLLATGITQLRL
jgi:hypothetical protein